MYPVARVSGIVFLHGKPSWTLLKLYVHHDIVWGIAKPTGPCKAHGGQAEGGHEPKRYSAPDTSKHACPSNTAKESQFSL